MSLTPYDDLIKTSKFGQKLSPVIKIDGKYEVALVGFILKNIYDI